MCTCTLLGHSYLDLFFISTTIALIINVTRDWVAGADLGFLERGG